MSDVSSGNPPTAFWIIAAVALFWNLIGVSIFYMQVTATPDALQAAYSEAEYEFISSIPAWATGAYAIAVVAGVIGCVLLLLRKVWAVPVFAISLVAILVQDTYSFAIADGISVFGAGAVVLPLVVLAIAVGLIFYSRMARGKGWLS